MAMQWPHEIWRLATILLTAASLMTLLTLVMAQNVSAQEVRETPSSQSQEQNADCPKQGQLDPTVNTYEDVSGALRVNGLGVPVGAEVKMRNASRYLVACYRTLVEGYFGPARITGGAFGFQAGEEVKFEVDGVAIQLAQPYTYHGDGFGHTVPDIEFVVEDWLLEFQPPVISLTATQSDTSIFVPITVTNVLSTPAYFRAFMTFQNGCISGFGDPSMILRPGESLYNHIYVNLNCSWKQGGASNSLILEEIRPIPILLAERAFLPIEVQAVNPPWIEAPAFISQTFEFVSEPKLVWEVKNTSRTAYDFYTTLELNGVLAQCYTKPAFKTRLVMQESQVFQSELEPNCMGSGTFTGTITLTKEVPISVEPPVMQIPVTVTILPNPWQVSTNAPLKIVSGMPYTYTMVVKNIGDRKRLGAATTNVQYAPFAVDTVRFFATGGEIVKTDNLSYKEALWAFEINPGQAVTLTATATATTVQAITSYEFVVGWQAPDLAVGSKNLEVYPQEQSEGNTKIYLPLIKR